MTPQELRELDAWICRNVFGRENVSFTSDFMGGGPEWDSDKPAVPNYTTDPAAAMLVLEKCIEKVGWTCIIGFGSTAEGNYFITHFEADPGSESFCTTEAETLPLLICLFAKKLFSK